MAAVTARRPVQMIDAEVAGVGAARGLAPVTVALHHEAADERGDRALAGLGVDGNARGAGTGGRGV